MKLSRRAKNPKLATPKSEAKGRLAVGCSALLGLMGELEKAWLALWLGWPSEEINGNKPNDSADAKENAAENRRGREHQSECKDAGNIGENAADERDGLRIPLVILFGDACEHA